MDILIQLNRTVERMNTDVSAIVHRVNSYEQSIQELIKSNRINEIALKQYQKQRPIWWPFEDISPNWFVFMIIWPFIAQRLAVLLNRNKQ